MKKKILSSFVSSLIMLSAVAYNPKPPRLTVVLVIDQCAYHYIDKLHTQLKHGLKYLLTHGINYTNAYWPAGQPGTATGHAGLNTGVHADYHGYVSNNWYEDGKKVGCDDDYSPEALVINPEGDFYDYGKSSCRLMVDGLSDQCALQTEPRSTFSVYSISGKSRSAIATAGFLGKPLWIDPQSGSFTSSKAYFDSLPEWIKTFNKNNTLDNVGSVIWEPMYPKSPYAYQFFNIDNYEYTRAKKTLLGQTLPVPDES